MIPLNKKIMGYTYFVVFLLAFPMLILHLCYQMWGNALIDAAALLFCGRLVFKDTMNVLQVVTPVYWITRDNGKPKTPILCRAFMRETQAPWRVGKGIQIRFRHHTFQIGLCRKVRDGNEFTPVNGRRLDVPTEELRTW